MKLFTPGPVTLYEETRKILAYQLPYNRTSDFGELTLRIIDGLKELIDCDGEVVLLTCSGTGAMEASVLNFLCSKDEVLIINGGTFGERWARICDVHAIPYYNLSIPLGCNLDSSLLLNLLSENKFTAVLATSHETSTGQLFNINKIGRIAKQADTRFCVDAIGSICADQINMEDDHIDVLVFSSQKGLALPPGLAFVMFNEIAIKRMEKIASKSFYFNFRDYLINQRRGQMPFTPAISFFVALDQRINDLLSYGLQQTIDHTQSLATFFRSELFKRTEFKQFPENPSHAITAVECPSNIQANKLVDFLAREYRYFVAPNSGTLKEKVFRVAHLGNQNKNELESLIEAIISFNY
jgi:aspartate aminotransferase-like enzyme